MVQVDLETYSSCTFPNKVLRDSKLILVNCFSPERVLRNFSHSAEKDGADIQNMAIHSWGLLFPLMTWKMWCPEGLSFSIWELAKLSLPRCHSITFCELYWELRSVRSALQESDLLIYRPLIRLALWRFYQANDELSPSFCVSLLSASSPLPWQHCIGTLSFTLHHHTLYSSYDAVHGWRSFALYCCWGSITGFIWAQSLWWMKHQLNGKFTPFVLM